MSKSIKGPVKSAPKAKGPPKVKRGQSGQPGMTTSTGRDRGTQHNDGKMGRYSGGC